MNFFKEQQLRLVLYSIILIILVISGFFAYIVWRDAKEFGTEQVGSSESSRPYSGLRIETSVLDSAKFKELKPVEVIDLPGGATTTTSTATGTPSQISQEDLKRVPRKNGNPFRPFN